MSATDDVTYLRRERELESVLVLATGSEQLITAPVKEPVTVDEVKRHLRIQHDDENELIDRYIRTARRALENDLRRGFLPQTWDVAIDEAPCYSAPILLPRAPVASVTSVTSYDTANVGTVFASSNYFVDTLGEPGRVCLNWGIVWPSPSNGLRETNAIIVRYVCGYATPELVPDDLTAAVLLMVGALYQHRDATVEIPEYIDALIAPYRLVRV